MFHNIFRLNLINTRARARRISQNPTSFISRPGFDGSFFIFYGNEFRWNGAHIRDVYLLNIRNGSELIYRGKCFARLDFGARFGEGTFQNVVSGKLPTLSESVQARIMWIALVNFLMHANLCKRIDLKRVTALAISS